MFLQQLSLDNCIEEDAATKLADKDAEIDRLNGIIDELRRDIEGMQRKEIERLTDGAEDGLNFLGGVDDDDDDDEFVINLAK